MSAIFLAGLPAGWVCCLPACLGLLAVWLAALPAASLPRQAAWMAGTVVWLAFCA